jgi:predicted DCC family thiol-disulfide oxidoreductase YuxK
VDRVERRLILYDGVCGLCDRFVQFVLARDPDALFSFAALQSDLAARALERHGLRADALDTVYLIEDFEGPRERVSRESDAALRVCARLAWPWSWVGALRAVPRFVRDRAYRLVARYRYRIFGKFDFCPLPSRATRARFLDLPQRPGPRE